MPAPRTENIAPLVRSVRGERVLFDADLATLYGVSTRALNQSSEEEPQSVSGGLHVPVHRQGMGCHAVTNCDRIVSGGDDVTSCDIIPAQAHRGSLCVEVNIAIMRTFVQLRRLMDSNRQLARKIEALEEKYDEQFAIVFDAVKRLIAEDDARKTLPKRRIGFVS